ncbi:MAG: hypothetical protein GX383_01980 [Clostridium sp.]|nr:hypothetical protein [Clostridium sp.]
MNGNLRNTILKYEVERYITIYMPPIIRQPIAGKVKYGFAFTEDCKRWLKTKHKVQ